MTPPASLYEIRRGHSGRTAEWGSIVVVRVCGGVVTFTAGGRTYKTTRSILWAATTWNAS